MKYIPKSCVVCKIRSTTIRVPTRSRKVLGYCDPCYAEIMMKKWREDKLNPIYRKAGIRV